MNLDVFDDDVETYLEPAQGRSTILAFNIYTKILRAKDQVVESGR